MSIEMVYAISSIVTIIAGLIAAFAVGLQFWSANIIASKQEDKIIKMETDARIKNPAIFSQESISLNVPDGELFIQKYLISINSPIQHIPLYTYIRSRSGEKGVAERIGNMQLNDVGGGVRKVEGVNVSYINTEYTLWTNRSLEAGEEIVFTLEQRSGVDVESQ